jgi:division protein CdvB (Snf7/Vps24/ESCRT-III family)
VDETVEILSFVDETSDILSSLDESIKILSSVDESIKFIRKKINSEKKKSEEAGVIDVIFT